MMQELLATPNYREFLRAAIRLNRSAGGGSFKPSDFARRVGLSRSFMSELLAGKKGLSRDSLARVRSGLKLPRPYLRLFELLVENEQPGLLRNKPASVEALKTQIAELKKIAAQSERVRSSPRTSQLISARRLFQIFASLGTLESGATLEQILARSHLPKPEVARGLSTLLDLNMIDECGGVFKATTTQVDLLLPGGDTSLATLTDEVASHLKKNVANLLPHPENDFFFTAFPIQTKRRGEFKRALQAAVLDLIDKYQDDEGDCIHQLFLASFN